MAGILNLTEGLQHLSFEPPPSTRDRLDARYPSAVPHSKVRASEGVPAIKVFSGGNDEGDDGYHSVHDSEGRFDHVGAQLYDYMDKVDMHTTSGLPSASISPPPSGYVIPSLTPHEKEKEKSYRVSLSKQPSLQSKMPKKRRSLQSIFIPGFLSNALPPSGVVPESAMSKRLSRMRSQSAAAQTPFLTSPIVASPTPQRVQDSSPASDVSRNSPPLQDLLGDDPFANLSPGPSFLTPSETPHTVPRRPRYLSTSSVMAAVPPPRSPLSPSGSSASLSRPLPEDTVSAFPFPIEKHETRPKSAGAGAHAKPAFRSRPSLPSLHTLSSQNVIIPTKTRRGKVGAGLPCEPWLMNDDAQDRSSGESAGPPSSVCPSAAGNRSRSGSRIGDPVDLSLALSGDFTDLSGSYSMEAEPLPSALATVTEPDDLDEAEEAASALLEVYDDDVDDTATSPTPPLTRSHSEDLTDSFAHLSPTRSPYVHDSLLEPDYMSACDPDDDGLDSPFDFHFYAQSSELSLDSSSESSSSTPSPEHDAVAIPMRRGTSSEHPVEDLLFESGSSAGTIRNTTHALMSARRRFTVLDEEMDGADPLVDAGEPSGQGRRGGKWSRDSGNGSSGRDGDRGAGGDKYPRDNGSRQGGSSGGRGGGDDRRDTNRNRSAFSSPSDTEESDSGDESNDDYGVDKAAAGASGSSTTDDDVPLAQRIPTALKAQNTIRRQVRDERDQRRKDRAQRYQQSGRSQRAPREATLSPPRGAAVAPHHGAPMSSSEEAALHASAPVRRVRTATLPSSMNQPFTIDDLTRKLINVQASGSPPAATISPGARGPLDATRSLQSRDPAHGRQDDLGVLPRQPAPNVQREKTLRPMRSFHRPERRNTENARTVPMPPISTQTLGRSTTGSRPRRAQEHSTGVNPPSAYPEDSRDDKSSRYRSSEEGGRSSKEGYMSARVSSDGDVSPGFRNERRPPVPPLPPAEVLANLTHSTAKQHLTQQRVFIVDMQRFNMVEVGASTNARDVLEMVDAQGALEGWAGTGGWMLFEVAQDFGMERPVRGYELLSDITGSWNKDKMVNTFLIKKTPLAPLLSRNVIPSASPVHGGYVEWESKRGKWNKRWLELKEHSLWLSKRETGKDASFLCSLSNFDAYFVTRLHKAPKPFVFSVKSTDNLSYFENAADYVHIFSCSAKDGEKWMENILLARSYVLHQERNVLFTGKPASGATPGLNFGTGNLHHAKSVSRPGPRSQRPAQPLVNVPPPFGIPAAPTAPATTVFEPGSLLAKQT
ncbi:hypothetical protein PLICRDRAFT_52488 [Plicaturopsis crispa FD-325 SS-3]|nr:hypothetical protein PLICRDRAFT_52488 [Plicaturopsis crispa FD-325 SS-3]